MTTTPREETKMTPDQRLKEAMVVAIEHTLREVEAELDQRDGLVYVVADMRQDVFTLDRLAAEALLKL